MARRHARTSRLDRAEPRSDGGRADQRFSCHTPTCPARGLDVLASSLRSLFRCLCVLIDPHLDDRSLRQLLASSAAVLAPLALLSVPLRTPRTQGNVLLVGSGRRNNIQRNRHAQHGAAAAAAAAATPTRRSLFVSSNVHSDGEARQCTRLCLPFAFVWIAALAAAPVEHLVTSVDTRLYPQCEIRTATSTRTQPLGRCSAHNGIRAGVETATRTAQASTATAAATIAVRIVI